MSARLAAEKAELEAVVTFLGQRLFARAGDAAELRESLQAVTAERDRLRGEVEAATMQAMEAENGIEPKPADEDWHKPLTTAMADIMDPMGR